MRRFVEPNVAGIPMGPLPKPVYPCGICSKNVGNRKSLTCDICGYWSHIGCEGISAYAQAAKIFYRLFVEHSRNIRYKINK